MASDDAARRTAFTVGAGVTLQADEWGEPGHPPVVLAHGGGQTRHSWGATAADLAGQGWHTLAYDHRGHGASDRAPDRDYSIDVFAQDCVDVCRQAAAASGVAPVVVGASLGGLSALLAEGLMDPGCATAVILVDVTPRVEPAGVERIVAFMSEHADSGFATLEDAADAIAAYRPTRARPTDLDGLSKNLRLGADGRWRWHWDPDVLRGPRPLGTRDMEAEFERASRALRVPTLLVKGRQSDVVSDQTAKEFLELCPHAQFVDVGDAGHMVAGDRNEAFSAAVVAFIGELR